MKKYEKYKDSGIEWIGEIPEHWGVEKLGYQGLFTSSGIDKKIIEGEPLVNMINYTDVYGNNEKILTRDRDYMVVSCPKSKQINHQVCKGDLIFTPSSETIEDIGLSALVYEDLPNTIFSYHVIRVNFLKKIDINFKRYFCNNHFVLNQFSKEAKGTTRQILGRETFKNIQVVIPLKLEQATIYNYLDRKTAEIDELVDKKEKLLTFYEEEKTAIVAYIVKESARIDAKITKTKKLIELLKEYRKALISEVVTGKIKITDRYQK